MQSLDPVLFANGNKRPGIEHLAVVCQDAFDAQPKASVVSQGMLQEARCVVSTLGRPDLGKTDPRVITT
jgi:hypothetical protein